METVTSPTCLPIVSWNTAIAGHDDCRRLVSTSSGNQPRTSATHCASARAAPPGTIPAAIAGAVYLRTVLRSTPKLSATCACERPACQCTKISVTSITSNVLLATGFLSAADAVTGLDLT